MCPLRGVRGIEDLIGIFACNRERGRDTRITVLPTTERNVVERFVAVCSIEGHVSELRARHQLQ